MYFQIIGFSLALIHFVQSDYVVITNDGPVSLNSTIRFHAQLYDSSGKIPRHGTFRFNWKDRAYPRNNFTDEGDKTNSTWLLSYPSTLYSPGNYEVEVRVSKWEILLYIDVASGRTNYNITRLLNGQIDLVQNETILGGNYVASDQEVIHKIQLNMPDKTLLEKENRTITSYWFLGCNFLGVSPNLSYPYNYTKDDIDKSRKIRVLLQASPLDINSSLDALTDSKTFNTSGTSEEDDDDDCDNYNFEMDPNNYYGYFTRAVIPTKPVHIEKISGTNWVKNGELLHLNLTCSGSPPFYYCVRFIFGPDRNYTNETCKSTIQTNNCFVSITRLLQPGKNGTALFIVSNKVTKIITPVAVTMFAEKKHPQLSVIIVPITCSAIAVVLIVFGIAYYIQSRSRFTIEVANFDFSRSNETEYKTFKERLKEAASTAFTRVHDDYSEDGGNTNEWSHNRKNEGRNGLLNENSDTETLDY